VTIGNRQLQATALSVVLRVTLLVPLLLVGSCQAQPPDSKSEATQVVNDIREEINLLAMLNRLSLSPEQAKKLVLLAGKAQDATAKAGAAREAAAARLVPLLEQQFDYMLKDQQVPTALSDNIAAAEAEIQEISDQVAEVPLSFAAEARSILTQPQILIATGGDEARQAAEEMLMWVRELTAEDFHGEARANAEALADPELGLDADTVFGVFEKARALPPDQYAAQVQGLTDKLAPLYRSGTAGEDALIGKLLVNRRLIPVLQRRMQYLTAGGGEG